MLETTVDHLEHSVLPAAREYEAAEKDLTNAKQDDQCLAKRNAKRKASDLAVALDGLTDRCKNELHLTLTQVRDGVSELCLWPCFGAPRAGTWLRVRGVANAYKHQNLRDQELPITSDRDVLVVGLGWGLDAWGVGKWGGAAEVLVQQKDGSKKKFMGDAVVAIAAWFKFLHQHGATLPSGPITILGQQVHPQHCREENER